LTNKYKKRKNNVTIPLDNFILYGEFYVCLIIQ